MTDKPDDDDKIDHIENFLRPFEKQSREELDRMFATARECIATEAELKRQGAAEKDLS